MSRKIRIVLPFRPLPLESDLHKALADFDWLDALRMVTHSAVLIHPGCPVHAITDVDTELPVAALHYETRHRRLMLWTLEACLRYLESPDFDRDTVMLDVDQLIYADLSGPFFSPGFHLGLLVRPSGKHADDQPLLNGVQYWRHSGKDRLVAFYRQALALAEAMPDAQLIWGADSDAVRALVEPIALGFQERAGLSVLMLDAGTVIEPLSNVHTTWIAKGKKFHPSRPVMDFRFMRKLHMRAVYDATIGRVA